MKKLIFTLFLLLGICLLTFNCGNNDDVYYGDGSSDWSALNVDSFSISLSATDEESSVSFDTILPGDTLLMKHLNFHSQTIRDIYVNRSIRNVKRHFVGAAYAEDPLPEPNSGVVDILISCDSAIYTSDSMIQAGVDITPLFLFRHAFGSEKWGDSQSFFKGLRNRSRLEYFTMKFPVKLEKAIDQKFTFTLVHINGDSTTAQSPRVVAH